MNELYTIARKKGTGAIIWSEDQKQYIIEQYTVHGKTIKALAEEFGIQAQSMRNMLRKNNIEIKKNRQADGYPRDSAFFSSIDCSEKAYWLGMFYADGTVSKDRNTIAIGLKDKEHVYKFKDAIKATNNKVSEIVDKRFSEPCYMYDFSIRDQQLHNDLIKLGCVPNKTYEKELHLPDIEAELLWDFLRGFFDGDGSISWSRTNNRYEIRFTGNECFLSEIRHFIGKDNISLVQNSVSKITYELRISGHDDVKRILSKMYENATRSTVLDRKFDIVNSCLVSLGASPLNL